MTDIPDLGGLLAQLRRQGNVAFASMATRRLEEMGRMLEEMCRGVFDLYGSHEDIVTGFTEYLACLRNRDDMYLTVSTPQFWRRANIGSDGRFLAMNQLAAVRGATIRRVFLLTEEDKTHPEYRRIMEAQLRVIADLSRLGKCSDVSDIRSGGYFVGYIPTTESQRQAEIHAGLHVGLLYQAGAALLLAPIYRDDGTIGYLQFRSALGLIRPTRAEIEKMLTRARPLTRGNGRGMRLCL